jgi:hypothetical protein
MSVWARWFCGRDSKSSFCVGIARVYASGLFLTRGPVQSQKAQGRRDPVDVDKEEGGERYAAYPRRDRDDCMAQIMLDAAGAGITTKAVGRMDARFFEMSFKKYRHFSKCPGLLRF